MKLFTKLALVSAVAVSGSAMAMESMDDSALSSATGQDGISIGLGLSKIAIENLYIHDNDGLAASAAFNGTNLGGTGNAGAITISATGSGANATDGLIIGANTSALLPSHNFADLTIDTDGGAAGGGAAVLNIGAQVSGLNIYVGKIGVAKSNAAQATGAVRGIDGASSTILSGLTLKTGVTSANIQLGNTPQGAMILLNGSMTGGLEISNLGIVDNAGKGQITLGKLSVADHGSADLSLDAKVSVKPQGLEIVGGGIATDMYIKNISLSDADYNTGGAAAATVWTTAGSSIGDVEVSNMRVFNGAAGTTPGAVITIRGH